MNKKETLYVAGAVIGIFGTLYTMTVRSGESLNDWFNRVIARKVSASPSPTPSPSPSPTPTPTPSPTPTPAPSPTPHLVQLGSVRINPRETSPNPSMPYVVLTVVNPLNLQSGWSYEISHPGGNNTSGNNNSSSGVAGSTSANELIRYTNPGEFPVHIIVTANSVRYHESGMIKILSDGLNYFTASYINLGGHVE